MQKHWGSQPCPTPSPSSPSCLLSPARETSSSTWLPCLASLAASTILIHQRKQNLPCIDRCVCLEWLRTPTPRGGSLQNISPTPSGNHWTRVNSQLGSHYLESKTQAPCQCPQRPSPSGSCLTLSSISYLSPLCLWWSSHQPDLRGDSSWGMFFIWLALYINRLQLLRWSLFTNPSEVKWVPSPVLFMAPRTMRNHHICSFIDRFIGYFLTLPAYPI